MGQVVRRDVGQVFQHGLGEDGEFGQHWVPFADMQGDGYADEVFQKPPRAVFNILPVAEDSFGVERAKGEGVGDDHAPSSSFSMNALSFWARRASVQTSSNPKTLPLESRGSILNVPLPVISRVVSMRLGSGLISYDKRYRHRRDILLKRKCVRTDRNAWQSCASP